MRPSFFTAIAFAGWILIGIVWTIFQFGNKKTIERPRLGRQVGASLLLFLGFLCLFGQRAPGLLGRQLTPANAGFGWGGMLLAAASVLFAIWARVSLGRNWSGHVPTLKENHELVQSGPYRYVRHPIYTGFLFAMLGTAMTIGLAASYLGVALTAVAFLIRIRTEEELMTRQFPEAYPEYKKRSKTLVPFVW